MEEIKKRGKNWWVSLSLRIGLAIVFLYPAISAITEPLAWTGFIPPFISSVIDPILFLHIHSAFELLLVIWFLSNWKVKYPAILGGLFTIAIVVTNLGAFSLVFRDVAVIFMCIALAILSWRD